jgi:hypothetical protein
MRIDTKYIYAEYYSVCPLAEIGTLPPPSLASECPHSPEPKGGGGGHSPAGEGLGESQFRRLEKCLALCLLCENRCARFHNILDMYTLVVLLSGSKGKVHLKQNNKKKYSFTKQFLQRITHLTIYLHEFTLSLPVSALVLSLKHWPSICTLSP